MPITDFKVAFVRDENNLVDILSTKKTRLTTGIYKLTQKIIHGLLTRFGDDELSPDWGCYLTDILRIPYSADRQPNVYSRVLAAVEKIESDIINLQSLQEDDGFYDETTILKELELLDVRANLSTRTWEVDIRVISVAGDELQFIL